MREVLATLGFRSVAASIHYEQLATLEMPVIIYLNPRELGHPGHFSVLRGVNASTVWLADPSLGNRTYSREQFISLWDTEARAQTTSEAQGRVLAILPTGAGLAAQSGFFTKKPRRQTAQAIEQIRVWAGRD